MIQKWDKILPVILLIISITVMLAWIFGQQTLYLYFPKIFIMAFNSSLCFTLAGTAILVSHIANYSNNIKRAIIICLAFIIVAIAFTILCQHLFHTSLGIDQFFVKVSIQLPEKFPGRMSPQTSLCFIMSAIVLCLFQAKENKKWQYLSYMLIISIFIIGLIGTIGQLLNANLIYDWQKYGRMAPHTSLGFVILASSFALNWIALSSQRTEILSNKDISAKYILIALFTIILVLGILFGVTLTNKLSRNQHIQRE